MKLKMVGAVFLSALAITWLTGCSAITDKVTEKAAESATESLLEKTTGVKDVDIDSNGGSVKVKTDQGETEISSGSGKALKIPDDFPKDFPIYDGAKVTGSIKSTNNGKTGFNIVLETSDDPNRVFKFYEDAIPKNGYTVSGTMELGDGNATIGVKKGDTEIGGITVTANDEGKTSIMIAISQ